MHVCVKGWVCVGGWTALTYRGMQQTCMCLHCVQVCFSPLCLVLSLTHVQPSILPLTHRPPSRTDSLTHSLFLHLHTTHCNTHTRTETCHTGSHSTSNTATDRHTHAHTPAPVTQEKMGWGSKHRDPAHPQNALLVHTRIPSHPHTHTQERTHPNEVEQRAQRQHVEAPVGAP